uniref:Ig-like domain-containing protein n=1 Tax=Salarias fasciatus TaxID=181472 RepID=A0A672IQM7_SALFA
IKSVAAQQNVTLTCPRSFGVKDLLFWLRIISGHQPEFLGGTYAFDLNKVTQTTHFTTKQGPGTFILHINHTQINDTGLYYCIRTSKTNMTFLRGVLLKVKGPQSSISSIIQAPPSAAVHPGESVSLQCSVLSDSEKKTCSEDYRVHWFRAGSHQSHPSFIYTHGDNVECGYSSQKCFYNFSKKVNVSDAGTYYCAVAACGEVMFGNGTNVDIKGKDEASLTYSAPTFSRRKVTKAERGNTHSAKKETIYSDVRFHN